MTRTSVSLPAAALAQSLGVWAHPDLLNASPRDRRKIHLDFHNSAHVDSIGIDFDATVFAETLTEAEVDSIVLFAKDMHGYFYYPSEFGPVHPGLTPGRDLLAEQIEACRARGIRTYVYYCTTWDNYLAEERPEWLCITRERRSYLPRFDETPAWTALCLANDDFVQLMLDHSREILERYRPDGIWYDMPMTNLDGECFCAVCLRSIRADGEDPFDIEVQRARAQSLVANWLEKSRELVNEIVPGCVVEQNNQTRLGLAGRAKWLENVEIEALPTGGWGYGYFPVSARYVRGVGLPFCGQTGRFQRAWADFGGLKSSEQLKLEVAAIAALGADVAVGDQPGPSAVLDQAVYSTIGSAFGALAQIDDHLRGAVGVAEAAILVEGLMLSDVARAESHGGTRLPTSTLGLTKLLTESQVQFDIIEADTPLDRYRCIFIAEGSRLSETTISAVDEYSLAGGRVVHAVYPDENADRYPWIGRLGLTAAGASPFEPAYMRFAGTQGEDTAHFDYALYDGAARWTLGDQDAKVLASLSEPAFQRTAEHYTSHAQSPAATHTGRPVAVLNDSIAAIAFPISASYQRHGYHVYRKLFEVILEELMPDRLIDSEGGPTLEVTATVQPAPAPASARVNVHVVNYAGAVRRSAEHLEYYDTVIPREGVRVALRSAADPVSVHTVRAGAELRWERDGGRIRVTLPRVDAHEIVSFAF